MPPIRPHYVFKSPTWKVFFPLFLTKPQRQCNDIEFFNLLQEIRIGQLSEKSKNMINVKVNNSKFIRTFYETTHVVGLRETADKINTLLCNNIPFDHTCNNPIFSTSIDTLDFKPVDNHNLKNFQFLTNLPKTLYIQEGVRMMFLNNKLFNHGICNRTIGIVTKIIDNENVEVTFPTTTSITKIIVQKATAYFEYNGMHISRQQFPLQKVFTLTVHKTQGLTLPHVTVSIDENIFAEGQVYVAMSRTTSWNTIDILSFDFNQIKVPTAALQEYNRLMQIHSAGLQSLR